MCMYVHVHICSPTLWSTAAEHDPRWVARAWEAAISGLLASNDKLVIADPDPRSPFNAGLFLLRPSRELYAEGITVLQRCLYNRTHGWGSRTVTNSSTPPTRLNGAPGALAAGDPRLTSWSFVGADQVCPLVPRYNPQLLHPTPTSDPPSIAQPWGCPTDLVARALLLDGRPSLHEQDQGLYFYMLYRRHANGAYGAGIRGALPLSRHWWAGFKPWMDMERHLERYGWSQSTMSKHHVMHLEMSIDSMDVITLAKWCAPPHLNSPALFCVCTACLAHVYESW